MRLWGKSEGKGFLFPQSGEPWLSLLVRSSPPSLENGVQGLVFLSFFHYPLSWEWASSGASLRPAFPECQARNTQQWGRGCLVTAEHTGFGWRLKALVLLLLLLPVSLAWWAGSGGPHDLPLSHSSDGDTDSVSTMVVHDVEEIAGTQTPYGGGTMVVQRVSGLPLLPSTCHAPSLAPALAPFLLFL